MPKHTRSTFPQRKLKITKCERCTVETSVNNSFMRESELYHLNEQLVSNKTGDFFGKVFGALNKHLASDLMHAKTQNFFLK